MPATDPGRGDGGGAVDWNLVALFEGGCDGRANTLPFERAAGSDGGMFCAGAPAGPGSSLEDHARALVKSVPWPNLVIESNPVQAIVAVPTYYWISSYNGSPREAHAPVTVQEGETCTEVVDLDGNPSGEQSCSPRLVGYSMTVTATPQSYTWTWDDVHEDRISHRLPPPTSLSLPDVAGLGVAFLPPLYPESQVAHVFQDSRLTRQHRVSASRRRCRSPWQTRARLPVRGRSRPGSGWTTRHTSGSAVGPGETTTRSFTWTPHHAVNGTRLGAGITAAMHGLAIAPFSVSAADDGVAAAAD